MAFLKPGDMSRIANPLCGASSRSKCTERTIHHYVRSSLPCGHYTTNNWHIMNEVEPPSRRSSVFRSFKDSQKLDIRAYQRTYEGAYTRASIAILVFSLMVTKLFSYEFLPIATVFTVYGCSIFIISVTRMNDMVDYYEPTNETLYYKTSGNIVIRITLVSVLSYIAMLILILRM
ncbi:CYFA0S06e00672g1_1 [Cyberlindnera fabianii]|uniref:CYFA0S06e00672g1_1 n=1 Tax=Cyberlindnera fabianii TaxID=36022 RepID=A0A061AU31_CYBFA|nr:CYFA0S06e00672g1_1 [Cyberlindnera fabianii]